MRLIDADAFDRFIASHEFSAAMNDAYDKDGPFEADSMYYSADSFRAMMKYRPTIDAVPVVHAHWETVSTCGSEDVCRCSHCNRKASFSFYDKIPYCWNCGAKMDEGVKS